VGYRKATAETPVPRSVGCRLAKIADVANVAKHFQLDRGPQTGLAATDLEVGKGAAFSDGSYFSDGSSFVESADVVRVNFRNRLIDVLHLCEEALKVFESMA
jgi:hypothetical protein